MLTFLNSDLFIIEAFFGEDHLFLRLLVKPFCPRVVSITNIKEMLEK